MNATSRTPTRGNVPVSAFHAGIARQQAAEAYGIADQACPGADTQSGITCDRSGSPANEIITG